MKNYLVRLLPIPFFALVAIDIYAISLSNPALDNVNAPSVSSPVVSSIQDVGIEQDSTSNTAPLQSDLQVDPKYYNGQPVLGETETQSIGKNSFGVCRLGSVAVYYQVKLNNGGHINVWHYLKCARLTAVNSWQTGTRPLSNLKTNSMDQSQIVISKSNSSTLPSDAVDNATPLNTDASPDHPGMYYGCEIKPNLNRTINWYEGRSSHKFLYYEAEVGCPDGQVQVGFNIYENGTHDNYKIGCIDANFTQCGWHKGVRPLAVNQSKKIKTTPALDSSDSVDNASLLNAEVSSHSPAKYLTCSANGGDYGQIEWIEARVGSDAVCPDGEIVVEHKTTGDTGDQYIGCIKSNLATCSWQTGFRPL